MALPFIDPKDRKNPGIYPDAPTMGKLEFVLELGPANRVYEDVRASLEPR